MARVLIGFGGNLGDRAARIDEMLRRLRAVAGVRVVACSSLYETAPVGGPEQGAFLNGALTAECDLTPEALRAALHGVEHALGRERTVRWGPRTMDLDILLFGERVVDTPALRIPHPRMRERAFVLVPAAEVAGEMVDPETGETVARLLERLGEESVRRDVRRWGEG